MHYLELDCEVIKLKILIEQNKQKAAHKQSELLKNGTAMDIRLGDVEYRLSAESLPRQILAQRRLEWGESAAFETHEGRRVFVNTETIDSGWQHVSYEETVQNAWNGMPVVYERCLNSILRHENTMFINLLHNTQLESLNILSVRRPETSYFIENSSILNSIRDAVNILTQHRLTPGSLLIHSSLFNSPRRATIFGINVISSNYISEDSFYLFAQRDYLGVMPIRLSLSLNNVDSVNTLTTNYNMSENIGMAILNPAGIIQFNIR